jgi:hypothetical protein
MKIVRPQEKPERLLLRLDYLLWSRIALFFLMSADAETTDDALWRPANVNASRTIRFRDSVNSKHGLGLSNYEELYQWSVANIADFWSDVWEETSVIGSKPPGPAVDPSAKPADNPTWFKDAKLNWAENMLRRRDEKIALVELGAYSSTHATIRVDSENEPEY